MSDISPLKLSLILIIIRDTESYDMLNILSKYTNSSTLQVIHMLEMIESKKFIEFQNGSYSLTMDGYSYLSFRDADRINLNNINETNSRINKSILSTYIPKSI